MPCTGSVDHAEGIQQWPYTGSQFSYTGTISTSAAVARVATRPEVVVRVRARLSAESFGGAEVRQTCGSTRDLAPMANGRVNVSTGAQGIDERRIPGDP
jgi:hypothetical protein